MVYLDSIELASNIIINIIKKDPDYNYWAIGITSEPDALKTDDKINSKNLIIYEAITTQIALEAKSLLIKHYSMEESNFAFDLNGRYVFAFRKYFNFQQ